MSGSPKARTLWPLPGGSGAYLTSLVTLLEMVSRTSDSQDVVAEMMQAFDLRSSKAARSYLRVPDTLGLIELAGPSVHLTDVGRWYLRSRDPDVVGGVLRTRVAGVDDVLAIISKRPARVSGILDQMRRAGFGWATVSQVRYRLRWLEEVGVVERRGRARPEYRVVPG